MLHIIINVGKNGHSLFSLQINPKAIYSVSYEFWFPVNIISVHTEATNRWHTVNLYQFHQSIYSFITYLRCSTKNNSSIQLLACNESESPPLCALLTQLTSHSFPYKIWKRSLSNFHHQGCQRKSKHKVRMQTGLVHGSADYKSDLPHYLLRSCKVISTQTCYKTHSTITT